MAATADKPSAPRVFLFVGGALCLDFANTVGGSRGPLAREYLPSYPDFVHWCSQAKLLSSTQAERLLRNAGRQPEAAAAVLQRAVGLREAIFRIFGAHADGGSAKPADLELLNADLARSLGRLRVVAAQDGFNWGWAQGGPAWDEPLGPIARSAAELLTSPHLLERVRRCAGETCDWLFVDATRNHSRRWCEMRDCGNLSKVRRFRQRLRRKRGQG